MSDLTECDLCGQESSDTMHTECGARFCGECDDDGAVYWVLCYDTGEEWAYLA